MRVAVEAAAPALPADRPRYLMGVGTPRDFFDAIAAGIDLFDCVTPTRHGRTHQVWTSRGRVNLRNAGWKNVDAPLDPVFRAPQVSDVPVGVLRHLCLSNEMLGATYLSLHNLHLFHELRGSSGGHPPGARLRDHWVPRLERRLTPDEFLAGRPEPRAPRAPGAPRLSAFVVGAGAVAPDDGTRPRSPTCNGRRGIHRRRPSARRAPWKRAAIIRRREPMERGPGADPCGSAPAVGHFRRSRGEDPIRPMSITVYAAAVVAVSTTKGLISTPRMRSWPRRWRACRLELQPPPPRSRQRR